MTYQVFTDFPKLFLKGRSGVGPVTTCENLELQTVKQLELSELKLQIMTCPDLLSDKIYSNSSFSCKLFQHSGTFMVQPYLRIREVTNHLIVLVLSSVSLYASRTT